MCILSLFAQREKCVFEEFYDDLGISVRIKSISFFYEFIFEGAVILDDTIMNDRESPTL